MSSLVSLAINNRKDKPMQINNDFKSLYFSNIPHINNYILSQDNKRIIFNRRPPDNSPVGHIDKIHFYEDNDLIFELISSSLAPTQAPNIVIDIIETFFNIGANMDMHHLRWGIYDTEVYITYTAYSGKLIYDSGRRRLSIAYASIPDYFCSVHVDLKAPTSLPPLTFRQFRHLTQTSPASLASYFTNFTNFRLRALFPGCPVDEKALYKLITNPALSEAKLRSSYLLSRAEEEYRCVQAKCSLFSDIAPHVVDVRDDGSLVFGVGVPVYFW